MNDSDIQLIVSLIDGQLPPAEREAAFARMEEDTEFQAAYEEQLAVASALRDVPAAAMSASERAQLHAALRSELRLEKTAAAPTKAGWQRWLAPLAGLATAAAVVAAFVIVPNLGEDEQFAEVGDALATTTAPTLASEPMTGALEDAGTPELDAGERLASTTTAAAAEGAEEAPPPEASQYFLAEAPDEELDVPVLGAAAFSADEVEALTRSATERVAVDYEAAAACFGSSGQTLGEAAIVGSVTQTGDEVVVMITDTTTGEEFVLTIDLATCEVTSAG